MAKIQKFRQFNSTQWVGPLEIKDIEHSPEQLYAPMDKVVTSIGTFQNISGSKLTKGYTYLLRINDNNQIIETGMSCVDLVVLVRSGWGYKVLSIKRGKEPFKGMWANPGGNIDEGENPIDAAVRELEEETGLKLPKEDFEYVGAFDKPWRDPRNQNCVSHAFKIILKELPTVTAGDDATECTWNEVDQNGDMRIKMAFDHNEVIKKAVTTHKI